MYAHLDMKATCSHSGPTLLGNFASRPVRAAGILHSEVAGVCRHAARRDARLPIPATIRRPNHVGRRQSAASMSCASAERPARERADLPAEQVRNSGVQRGWKAALTLVALVIFVTLLPQRHAFASAAKDVPVTSPSSVKAALKGLLSFILHLDKHLSQIITSHGQATYIILFMIVFCETGLVLTPFLPGDSLLFACGAFAARGSLNLAALFGVFITSAILGDAVNYAIGNYIGAKAIDAKLINQDYIAKTEEFYKNYGGKTVVLARFVPIVRTFAPFVAGVGSMAYRDFLMYNVGGAVLWTLLFVFAGFFFGGLPFVQHNFTLVVFAIVVVSVLPIVFEVVAARRTHSNAGAAEGPGKV